MTRPDSRPDLEKVATVAAKAGLAGYALESASKGHPDRGVASKAAVIGGQWVILGAVFKFLLIPYAIITAIVCAIPIAAVAGICLIHGTFLNAYSSANNTDALSTAGIVFVCLTSAACISVWIRWPMYKWAWKRFLKPVDHFLSGKPAPPAHSDQAQHRERRPLTDTWGNPIQHTSTPMGAVAEHGRGPTGLAEGPVQVPATGDIGTLQPPPERDQVHPSYIKPGTSAIDSVPATPAERQEALERLGLAVQQWSALEARDHDLADLLLVEALRPFAHEIDLSFVTESDLAAVTSFIDRHDKYQPGVRESLAQELVDRIGGEVRGVPRGLSPMFTLFAVWMASLPPDTPGLIQVGGSRQSSSWVANDPLDAATIGIDAAASQNVPSDNHLIAAMAALTEYVESSEIGALGDDEIASIRSFLGQADRLPEGPLRNHAADLALMLSSKLVVGSAETIQSDSTRRSDEGSSAPIAPTAIDRQDAPEASALGAFLRTHHLVAAIAVLVLPIIATGIVALATSGSPSPSVSSQSSPSNDQADVLDQIVQYAQTRYNVSADDLDCGPTVPTTPGAVVTCTAVSFADLPNGTILSAPNGSIPSGGITYRFTATVAGSPRHLRVIFQAS